MAVRNRTLYSATERGTRMEEQAGYGVIAPHPVIHHTRSPQTGQSEIFLSRTSREIVRHIVTLPLLTHWEPWVEDGKHCVVGALNRSRRQLGGNPSLWLDSIHARRNVDRTLPCHAMHLCITPPRT